MKAVRVVFQRQAQHQPPSFNVVGQWTSQIAQALNGEQQPVQAYVVSGEMTSQQEMDRNIQ